MTLKRSQSVQYEHECEMTIFRIGAAAQCLDLKYTCVGDICIKTKVSQALNVHLPHTRHADRDAVRLVHFLHCICNGYTSGFFFCEEGGTCENAVHVNVEEAWNRKLHTNVKRLGHRLSVLLSVRSVGDGHVHAASAPPPIRRPHWRGQPAGAPTATTPSLRSEPRHRLIILHHSVTPRTFQCPVARATPSHSDLW